MTKHYEISGQIVQTVSSTKYLGVIISDDLSRHEQIAAATKKGKTTLHLIARNLNQCPQSIRALA